MSTTNKAQRITPENQPTFPCWLWHPSCATKQGFWERFPQWDAPCSPDRLQWEWWHPDQPTAPTSRPQAEVPEWIAAVTKELCKHSEYPLPPSSVAAIIARHAPADCRVKDAQSNRDFLLRQLRNLDFCNYPVASQHNLESIINQVEAGHFSAALSAPSSEGPSEQPSDKDMLDWLENEMTRFTCYSEPEANGDWYRLEYWKRSDNRATHIAEATGPTLRATIAAAVKAQATSKGEGQP